MYIRGRRDYWLMLYLLYFAFMCPTKRQAQNMHQIYPNPKLRPCIIVRSLPIFVGLPHVLLF